jgi:hypothetical protein
MQIDLAGGSDGGGPVFGDGVGGEPRLQSAALRPEYLRPEQLREVRTRVIGRRSALQEELTALARGDPLIFWAAWPSCAASPGASSPHRKPTTPRRGAASHLPPGKRVRSRARRAAWPWESPFGGPHSPDEARRRREEVTQALPEREDSAASPEEQAAADSPPRPWNAPWPSCRRAMPRPCRLRPGRAPDLPGATFASEPSER